MPITFHLPPKTSTFSSDTPAVGDRAARPSPPRKNAGVVPSPEQKSAVPLDLRSLPKHAGLGVGPQASRYAQYMAAPGAKLNSSSEQAAELGELCKQLSREGLGTRFLVLGARGCQAPFREDFWDDMLMKYLLDPSSSKLLFTGELVIGPHENPIPFDYLRPGLALDRIIGKLQQAERILRAPGPLSEEASDLVQHRELLGQCFIALGDIRARAVHARLQE